MILHLVEDGTVAAIGLADTLRNGPHVALNSVDRENGACLRSVSFLPRTHPKGVMTTGVTCPDFIDLTAGAHAPDEALQAMAPTYLLYVTR